MLTFLLYKISKEDLRCRLIPDECSLAICILAVGRGGFSLSTLCLALLLVMLTGLVMGFGDAKLFGALTLLLGLDVLLVMTSSFLLAAAYSIPGLITGDLHPKDHIAFAPFIAVPALTLFIQKLA